jgi:hypothetical protein
LDAILTVFGDERIAENQILFQKHGGKVHTNGYGVRVFWKYMIEFLGQKNRDKLNVSLQSPRA